MATATLRPSGDGTTTGWTQEPVTGAFADKIDDDPESHDSDTTYVLSPNILDGSMWVALDDVPADFDPDAINSITLKVAAKKINTPVMAVDLSDLYVQLQRTDEATAISVESSVCNVTSTSSYTLFTRTPAATGSHTVSDWNAAKLKLRFDHTAQQTIDDINQIRITAAEVIIDYTPAAGTFTATAAPTAGGADGSASATFSPGTHTATAAPTAGGADASASATFSPGTHTATSAPAAGGADASASATFSPGTHTATAAPTAGGADASASATFSPGTHTATAAPTAGGVDGSASATFISDTRTATASPAAGGADGSASATFSPGTHTATAAATAGGADASASATFMSDTRTATLALETGGVVMGTLSTLSVSLPERPRRWELGRRPAAALPARARLWSLN